MQFWACVSVCSPDVKKFKFCAICWRWTMISCDKNVNQFLNARLSSRVHGSGQTHQNFCFAILLYVQHGRPSQTDGPGPPMTKTNSHFTICFCVRHTGSLQKVGQGQTHLSDTRDLRKCLLPGKQTLHLLRAFLFPTGTITAQDCLRGNKIVSDKGNLDRGKGFHGQGLAACGANREELRKKT